MKFMFKRSLLLSSVALMAAPSFALCSMADPARDFKDLGGKPKKAEKPLVDTWVYPEDGSAPYVTKLKEGAKPPKGCAFQPSPLAQTEAVTEEGNEAESAKLRSVEADRDQLNDKLQEAHKTVGIQETQIKKLQSDVEDLTAEKSSLAESAQALHDTNGALNTEVDALKAQAKTDKDAYEALEAELEDALAKAKTSQSKAPAKTVKAVKETGTDTGDGDGQKKA